VFNLDKRFFEFESATYKKRSDILTLSFFTTDNFEPEIQLHERRITRAIHDEAGDNVRIQFEYKPMPKGKEEIAQAAMNFDQEKLNALFEYQKKVAETPIAPSVDKTLKITGKEYWLGRPINMRPIQIKYIKPSGNEVVTAGTILRLKRHDYKKTGPDGKEVEKVRFTFTLDDGADQIQCVYFGTKKYLAKFEKLVDHTTICVIGTYDKRGNFTNFVISGIYLCEM